MKGEGWVRSFCRLPNGRKQTSPRVRTPEPAAEEMKNHGKLLLTWKNMTSLTINLQRFQRHLVHFPAIASVRGYNLLHGQSQCIYLHLCWDPSLNNKAGRRFFRFWVDHSAAWPQFELLKWLKVNRLIDYCRKWVTTTPDLVFWVDVLACKCCEKPQNWLEHLLYFLLSVTELG